MKHNKWPQIDIAVDFRKFANARNNDKDGYDNNNWNNPKFEFNLFVTRSHFDPFSNAIRYIFVFKIESTYSLIELAFQLKPMNHMKIAAKRVLCLCQNQFIKNVKPS